MEYKMWSWSGITIGYLIKMTGWLSCQKHPFFIGDDHFHSPLASLSRLESRLSRLWHCFALRWHYFFLPETGAVKRSLITHYRRETSDVGKHKIEKANFFPLAFPKAIYLCEWKRAASLTGCSLCSFSPNLPRPFRLPQITSPSHRHRWLLTSECLSPFEYTTSNFFSRW